MQTKRRSVVQALGAAMLGSIAPSSRAAETPRKLGLIIPPAGRGTPEEGIAMYGERIEYLIEGLGLQTMTPEGYEAVLDRIGPAAEKLVARGAEVVIVAGTSLTFYKGEAYNQQVTQLVRSATGLPVTTMSTAVIDGLKAMGATRVVAPTAYNDEVNGRLRSFLLEHGFEVLAVQGLGVEAVEDINLVQQPQLLKFCVDVTKTAPDADAILVSCGGLRTLEILAPLELQTGLPAVSSMPHTLFAGAKLLGMDARVAASGRLMAS